MKNESVLNIEIFGKNYTVSDGLTNVTLKKCSKLDNYFKDDENAKVNITVTLEGDTYETDLVVSTRGLVYRASAASDSPYTNLDLVIPKVLGQVRKQKSIWGRRGIAVDKRKAKKPEPIIEDTRE
jgi:putative sigma-54 modulation protein